MNENMKTYLKSARIILEQGGDCNAPTCVLCDDCPFRKSDGIKDPCHHLGRVITELEKFIEKHRVPTFIELEGLE